MNKKIIVFAMAALALLVIKKSRAAPKANAGAPAFGTQAQLLANLAGQVVTLAGGAVLDTGTGTIFDPVSGRYTNVYTGQLVYAP